MCPETEEPQLRPTLLFYSLHSDIRMGTCWSQTAKTPDIQVYCGNVVSVMHAVLVAIQGLKNADLVSRDNWNYVYSEACASQ